MEAPPPTTTTARMNAPPPTFLTDDVLKEHRWACAFARAEHLLEGQVEGLETKERAKAFLMEVYGTVERVAMQLGDDHPASWHPRLLMAALHLLQGEVSFMTGDLEEARQELEVAWERLEEGRLASAPVVGVAVRVVLGLGKLAWERGRWVEAEDRLLRLVALVEEWRQGGGEAYSLADLTRWAMVGRQANVSAVGRAAWHPRAARS